MEHERRMNIIRIIDQFLCFFASWSHFLGAWWWSWFFRLLQRRSRRFSMSNPSMFHTQHRTKLLTWLNFPKYSTIFPLIKSKLQLTDASAHCNATPKINNNWSIDITCPTTHVYSHVQPKCIYFISLFKPLSGLTEFQIASMCIMP